MKCTICNRTGHTADDCTATWIEAIAVKSAGVETWPTDDDIRVTFVVDDLHKDLLLLIGYKDIVDAIGVETILEYIDLEQARKYYKFEGGIQPKQNWKPPEGRK